MLRDLIRNIVLTYSPPKVSFAINVWKNVRSSYLEAEMPYIQKILQASSNSNGSPVSVDIGANLGLFSYLMSCDSSQVIAIEPQIKLANYLKSVLPKNVTVKNLAVSDRDGIAQMRIPKVKGLAGSSAQKDALATIEDANQITRQKNLDFIEVPIKTLDKILENQPKNATT